jgi:tetratricopeptide (TPR) repeat protein
MEQPDDVHRTQAVAANQAAWAYLERDDLAPDDATDLLRCAFASAYHWARAADRRPERDVRAEHLIAKAYVKLGNATEAVRHAQRCLDGASAAGLDDFDLAYAHEAMARAQALAGDTAGSLASWRAARAVPIADPEDRAIVDSDFADAPR